MEIDSAEFTQISIVGRILGSTRWGSLQDRTRLYDFCTDSGFKFLGSPYPYVPLDMNTAFVQT